MITKKDVADAIHSIPDPFNPKILLGVMGVRVTKKNIRAVQRILNYFENRGWVTLHSENLYLRTFKRFSF